MTFAPDLHLPDSRSPITHNALLVVEGYDTFRSCLALLRDLALEDKIELRNAGSISNLPKYMRALPNIPGFENVVSLGVIRDSGETNLARQR